MPATAESVDTVWFTRCPVPTASGLAYALGRLATRYADLGVDVGILQDAPLEIARHHYDHDLVGLIREGGNVPAIAARAEGARTRLVGLTWIDEGQSIMVRPDSAITSPAALRGARIAVPGWAATRDTSHARAMALHGFKGALGLAGLTLDDVEFVELPLDPVLPPGRIRAERAAPRFRELDELTSGRVDAVYVKGAASLEAARVRGAVVGIDLDAVPSRRSRVNNGTPRPITVHEELLQSHSELVVEFLVETLRAADWAAGDLNGVREVLAAETGSGAEGVLLAYREGFHRTLHPTLDEERVDLLRVQKALLLRHGFLRADFDLDSWIDPRPLRLAYERLASRD
ncbi:ABC transporter substrate-binding protein [Microbispora bryophytorum]|uniref:Monooxygenase n=1 Tax=Microbispora bryophytorum TaxID=1460882 RepID=A0A8H9H0N2_9ACTN|nr:ABC transporter substrate-binding protein [Microbispora bryophytorum]MBD3140108.1 ABC transporter substrate-binding protein [Microbispora bryophytorum]TQS04868.1 ABC transporter substrate-binding protein [Microbispora bryophytorum]GGO16458.1 monooxygenase [Microbispora bryophytorum]